MLSGHSPFQSCPRSICCAARRRIVTGWCANPRTAAESSNPDMLIDAKGQLHATCARTISAGPAMAGCWPGVSVALLLVTALGIVGLANFWVQQRRRRSASAARIGATRGDILRYFQTENFLIVSGGIGLGMLLAFVLEPDADAALRTAAVAAVLPAGRRAGAVGAWASSPCWAPRCARRRCRRWWRRGRCERRICRYTHDHSHGNLSRWSGIHVRMCRRKMRTVLIIDDNPAVGEALSLALSLHEIRPLVALTPGRRPGNAAARSGGRGDPGHEFHRRYHVGRGRRGAVPGDPRSSIPICR